MRQTMNEVDGHRAKSIPWLLMLYREDENDSVQAHAIRGLGRMRDRNLTDFFIEVLKSGRHEDFRSNAAWALGGLGHQGVLADLEEASRGDSSEKVRKEAQKATETIHLALGGKNGEAK
ncbi:MAG: hypothetical protein A2Z34_01540 [Planctomycetes bacterium RBG_16_59_8]|nr:MAG: hypothetical protein A2Z34_01540 [Planctomycetes bacterium RBG_16_59_8]